MRTKRAYAIRCALYDEKHTLGTVMPSEFSFGGKYFFHQNAYLWTRGIEDGFWMYYCRWWFVPKVFFYRIGKFYPCWKNAHKPTGNVYISTVSNWRRVCPCGFRGSVQRSLAGELDEQEATR